MVEIEILKALFASNAEDTLTVMANYLTDFYPEVIKTEDYLFAKGEIPIVLCAHADTVFKEKPFTCYDPNFRVLYSITEGMGADDKAGVYGIYDIVKSGYKPHIVITNGEEKGCLGARKLCKDYPKLFSDAHFVIQLDRRGEKDCVFYDCGNPEFTTFIESFDFKTALGSFTDIVELCPNWGIAGVNLSVGYYNEHTDKEFLFVDQVEATIEKVKNILESKTKKYEYIEIKRSYYFGPPKEHHCSLCHVPVDKEEFMYVTTENGELDKVCFGCLAAPSIKWCYNCGNPFYSDRDEALCFDCKEEAYHGSKRRRK